MYVCICNMWPHILVLAETKLEDLFRSGISVHRQRCIAVAAQSN